MSISTSRAEPVTSSAAPSRSLVAHADSHHHLVHFYEDEASLSEVVAQFVLDGLSAGQPAVIIATPGHRDSLCAALRSSGCDVDAEREASRLVLLDARELLEQLMDGAMPSEELFARCVEARLVEVAACHPGARLRAYGEMVDLLWREGRQSAALRLEELWNELQTRHPLSLLCAYVMSSFYKETASYERICRAHTHVVSSPARAAAALEQHRRIERARAIMSQRTERLMKVTAAIAEAVTPEEVNAAIVEQISAALGASSAGLFARSPSGTALLVRSIGYTEHGRAVMAEVPLERGRMPVVDALLTGRPIWLESQAELLQQYPHLSSLVSPMRSYRIACLPLSVEGAPVAALGLTFDDDRALDPEERGFLQLVSRYAELALARQHHIEVERRLRAAAEISAERQRLLSRWSRAFAEMGPEFASLLDSVAQEITRDFARACTMNLIAEDGRSLPMVAAYHRSAELCALIQEHGRRLASEVGVGLLGQVAASGRGVIVGRDGLRRFLDMVSAERRDLALRLDPSCVVVVPLRARGTVIGTLTAVRSAGDPPFVSEDLELLHELGERAAAALENRRLYLENEQGRVRAELLYSMAEAVMRARDVGDVFTAALDAIAGALGTERSSILAFDPDGVMRFKAWRGLSDEYRHAVEGHSPWTRDEVDPEPLLVPDVEHDPQMRDYLPTFRAEGIAALGFIPLVAGGRLLGKFMVYYREPRRLTAAEVEVGRTIATHVAAALARFSAVAELRETVRFNEMFTGILGHDLRNPLGAIMTAAQLLVKRGESDRMMKPLARILSSGERMARMIDQLLDFTRVRVGSGIPLQPRPTDVVSVVRQVMDELDDAHPEWTFRLEQRGGDAGGSWDPDRLSQVFSNLVANAVQHGAPEAGVRVLVDGQRADGVVVEIHNTGVIPEALLPKLFEPMAGGDRRRDGSRGLGLGLYISQEICRAHGGRIEVVSSVADGTCFRVWLPRVN